VSAPLPNEGTVAERIRVVRNHLAPAELAVAKVILENYPTGGLVPIVQLATAAEVSAPTVLRLVSKLGFDGYGAFHETLRAEIHQRIFSPVDAYPDSKRQPAAETPAARAQAAYVDCIRSTFSHLDVKELKAAVSALADVARPVVVMGGRISAILATQLATYLSMLRKDVTHIASDGTERISALVDLKPRTVVVLFDFRHYQQSTLDWGLEAAKRRAHLILVTDQFLSPLASHATTLLTSSTKGLEPFDSMAGGFVLTELLISEVARALGSPARKRLGEFLALQQADEQGSPGMTPIQKGLREK
jgi:DNA-binding MurR/RpiR family transcriptional regulator